MENKEVLETLLEVKNVVDSNGDRSTVIKCNCTAPQLLEVFKQLLKNNPKMEILFLHSVVDHLIDKEREKEAEKKVFEERLGKILLDMSSHFEKN